jgi:hypothetical protein
MNARKMLAALALVAFGAAGPVAAESQGSIDELSERLDAVLRQNQAMQERIDKLENEVRSARDEAHAARALAGDPPPVSARPQSDGFWTQPLGGGARFQLLDVSLDVLTAAGFSSVDDEILELLQGGDHDPRRRGFSLPAVELSFIGAVDPYFTGEVHLLYFLDQEGESRFELEEAFVTTSMLPFGLERHGLQLKLGHFFTEFGRHNPTHPHAWHWQDQPVVMSRFFGEDGMRGPGARAGWLLPLPWYSEILLGAQNAQGETMVSFLASDEVFEERPIGGRPFADVETSSPSDLVYLGRWIHGFDLSTTWSTQLGVSGLLGPNATGSSGRTTIYGLDGVFKWTPLATDRGWPFVVLEGEILRREYKADSFFGCPLDEPDCDSPFALSSRTLRDWGGYGQALWGFRRGFAAGLRYEYASGSGASVGPFDGRRADPFRDDRHRVSPLLVWYPSEFSRIRFQYNFDRADFLEKSRAHSFWVGLEFFFGSHPAHRF